MGLNDSDILTELPIHFFFSNFFIAIHYATLRIIFFLRWLLLTKKKGLWALYALIGNQIENG